MDDYCRVCGISRKSAYISYDGYKSPRIQKKCIKEIKKCDNKECMICELDGGHIVELYNNGRHTWKENGFTYYIDYGNENE